MYHSLTFFPESVRVEDIETSDAVRNTWDDWHLIPVSRPVFQPPEVKVTRVDVPGSYGLLDLSESLTGYPVFNNRTGSVDFYVENDHEKWEVLFSQIQNYLHGKVLRVVMEDDPGFYYVGRFGVDEWESGKNWSSVTISYSLYPFKKEMFSSTEDWLWDPFPFETGIVREYNELDIPASPSSLTITIPALEERIVPTFTVTTSGASSITLTYNGNTYTLPTGTTTNPNIVIGARPNNKGYSGEVLVFKCDTAAKVTIAYRGGSL